MNTITHLTLLVSLVAFIPGTSLAGKDDLLIHATKTGDVAAVVKLLAQGADPDVMTVTKVWGEDEDANDVLFEEEAKLFNWLIDGDSQDPEYPSPPPATRARMIPWFIQAGVDLSYERGRQTSRLVAVLFGGEDIIRAFLECNARLDGADTRNHKSNHEQLRRADSKTTRLSSQSSCAASSSRVISRFYSA